MMEYFNYLNTLGMTINEIKVCAYRNNKYYFLDFSTQTDLNLFYTNNLLFDTTADCLYYPTFFTATVTVGKYNMDFYLKDISGKLNIIPSYDYDVLSYEEVQTTILKYKQTFVISINNFMMYMIALDNIYRSISNGNTDLNTKEFYDILIKNNGYNLYKRNYTLQEAINTVKTLPIKPPVLPKYNLTLLWDNLSNVPVVDPYSLDDWNTFFDLPANGTPFTYVNINGKEIRLTGETGLVLKDSLFNNNSNILEITDEGIIVKIEASCFLGSSLTKIILPNLIECEHDAFNDNNSLTTIIFPKLLTAGTNCFASDTGIVTYDLSSLVTAGSLCFDGLENLLSINLPSLTSAGTSCFQGCIAVTSFILPSLITVGDTCFRNCYDVTSFYMPSCISLGTSVSNNNVFMNITSNNITLTVPEDLMICNSGNPDGDIKYLTSNNTVTVVEV